MKISQYLFLLPLLFLLGCTSSTSLEADALGSPKPITRTAVEAEAQLEGSAPPQLSAGAVVEYGLTNQNPDGNRYLPGQLNMPAITPLDIPLDGKPIWVAGMGLSANSSLWLVSLDDGRIQAFLVKEGTVFALDTFPQNGPEGMPPALGILGGQIVLLNELADDVSPLSHPILLAEGTLAFISREGDLLINNEGEELRLEVNALLDGRILSNGEGELLFLSDPSTVYNHGIMGDALEARGVTRVTVSEEPKSDQIITLPAQTVVEGISPIWADLNNDGTREIIITQSNVEQGAQIVVYDDAGQWLAASDPIGQGYRWRHQLAVAPFGPNAELELVSVFTPHIGGIVEFFQINGEKLDVVAQVEGYTSHVVGSRNLDMALAADLDADGQVELLLPNQGLSTLAAIRRTADGAEVAWELALGDFLSSNLASARFEDGTLAIGAGLQSGLLRLWLP